MVTKRLNRNGLLWPIVSSPGSKNIYRHYKTNNYLIALCYSPMNGCAEQIRDDSVRVFIQNLKVMIEPELIASHMHM